MVRGAKVFVTSGDKGFRAKIAEVAESLDCESHSIDHPNELASTFRESNGCIVLELHPQRQVASDSVRPWTRIDVALPVVVVADRPTTTWVVQAMQQGAMTVIDSPADSDDLVDAIRAAIHRSLAEREKTSLRRDVRERIERLTPSERRVMDLMIEGLANKVIAKRLKVSVRTVESRRHEVFAKLEVKSLAELVRTVVLSD